MDAPSETTHRAKPTRADELQSALDQIHRVGAEREPSALLFVIAQEGARLLDAERATIFLLDRDRCELVSQATLDGHSIRLDARLGIVGAAALSGQVVNVTDAQHDDRFYQVSDIRTHFRTRNALAVPLRSASGDVVGVFQALNKKRGSFTAEDQTIAEALGKEAALLLERMLRTDARERPVPGAERAEDDAQQEAAARFSTRNIVGTSQRIQGIIRLIDLIRDSSVDVLITGESGTGKEMIGKAIHYNSPRARHPFVALNCAALPENLAESELFGHEKGSFTGAVERRIGKFEQAQDGTLFLDEIGDLALSAQAKILRALQERVIERVGGRSPIPVNSRIIAATHVNLEEAIRQGRFREDLYYRLKVVEIETPALREVREEIPVLAQHFLEKYCQELGKEPKTLAPAVLRRMTEYSWPGNVRQLENEIKRLVVSVRRTTIGDGDLSEAIRVPGPVSSTAASDSLPRLRPGVTLKDLVDELEIQAIRDALRASGNNQVKAAKVLGLSRQGLIKKMNRFKITRTAAD